LRLQVCLIKKLSNRFLNSVFLNTGNKIIFNYQREEGFFLHE
jgi:hypothetical protein